MNNKKNLVGKTVSLFLDGGWEIAGEVKSVDDNKFIVEQDGNLFMVFKDKVSCLLISEKSRVLKDSDAFIARGVSKGPRRSEPSPQEPSPEMDMSLFPMNGISYDESGMSIPKGLLGDVPDGLDDNFSVFFPGGHNLPESNASKEDGPEQTGSSSSVGIEFGVKDDIKDQG